MKRMIRWFFLIVSLFLWASVSHALTLGNILDRVRPLIRDTATTSTLQRYSDSYLTVLANEGQREVANLTWCVVKSTTVTLSANTTYYSLPTDYIAVKDVVYIQSGASAISLPEWTQDKVNSNNPDFESMSAGTPSYYFTSPPSNTATRISFIPVPNSSSLGTMKIRHIAQSADMSATTDVPFNGYLVLYPYHDVIVDYVVMRIKLIESEADTAAIFQKFYMQKVDIMSQRLGNIPNYKPSVSGAK
jgi:hypothetical protein